MQIWNYIKFAMRLKEVERSVFATTSLDRKENVAEHSWSMAAIFWVLKSELRKEFPDLNIEKIYDLIQMHDLVEINTGDISTWVHHDADQSKEQREQESLEQIIKLLPDNLALEFRELFDELEAKETIEAKLVKGIDRISPAIQRVVTGQGWKSEGMTEAQLDELQLRRLEFSVTLQTLYQELKQEAKSHNLL